jgi:hypothetical protein
MTSQNQQPRGPSQSGRPAGRPGTHNSSWTTSQPIHTKSLPPQQPPLPKQQGPIWDTLSRPMPASQYQRVVPAAPLTASSPLPTNAS